MEKRVMQGTVGYRREVVMTVWGKLSFGIVVQMK